MEKINKRLLSWASILEDKTRQQAEQASRMPFVFPHIALMPDAHLGKGATVGSVIPTDRAVIPAADGVDIGCGMIAVRTQFTREALPEAPLAELRRAIEAAVPLSAGVYNTALTESAKARGDELGERAAVGPHGFDPAGYAANWMLQLGTLGSGNHFIEVTVDECDRVWCFLRSGSRGVGNKIAQKHIAIARRLCEMWWIRLPDPDLAYLVEGTDEFAAYIHEMSWAQHFALLNRAGMMDRVVAVLAGWVGEDIHAEETINTHHNYTTASGTSAVTCGCPERAPSTPPRVGRG